jgi:hypothetical protein
MSVETIKKATSRMTCRLYDIELNQQENDEPLMMRLELKILIESFSFDVPSHNCNAALAISSPVSITGCSMLVMEGVEYLHSGSSSKLTIAIS